jgi:hypothetical protein
VASITLTCPICDADFDIELEYEPADPHFGSDADGNRGVYIPGYYHQADVPGECPVCKGTFAPDELSDLINDAKFQVDDHNYYA